MAIGANSYSTLVKVGALVPKWAGATINFAATTRPSATQVEVWIDEVSAMLNIVLAAEGFTTPVVQADVVLMLDNFVAQEVAAFCEGANGYGKFGPSNNKYANQGNRYSVLNDDVVAFVEAFARGMSEMGAARTNTLVDSSYFRTTDESGDTVHPIFQREAFGDAYKNWDVTS